MSLRSWERNRAQFHVKNTQELSRELKSSITVLMPIPKGDRARFLVEKLTELGVAELVPVKTQHSVFQEKSVSKLQRYVIEACKQCGRNRLMVIGEVQPFSEVVGLTLVGHKLILDPKADSASSPADGADLHFLLGPEGGFSEDELQLANENGWQSICLGPAILRMETAAIAAVGRYRS